MASVLYVVFIHVFIGVSTGQVSVVDQLFCPSWSAWITTPVSVCGATCGMGTTTQNRTRQCNPSFGNPVPTPPVGCRFAQVEVTTRTCTAGVPCTGVAGTWGAWANEGLCSTYCGPDGAQTQRRTRTCTPAGLCSAALVERREVFCIRGAFQLTTCFRFGVATCEGRGFQTFLYDYILPFFNLCVNGRYQQVRCPAIPFTLLATCGRDVLRCNLYRIVEFVCLFI
ncbi:adhesion G protein-coupled receptor B2-like [Haliotis rufescens]|uniref:adhesion G protein-coupled receptor B2-like n=1 Tax=Haliotis rufescens TaxID=6454 RepID=UPI001EAFD44A|nr:adhesion G protein-coupled receptor B2-like [Haliotis rufescens]